MTQRFLWLLAIFFISEVIFSQVEQELNPPDYIKTITFQGQTNESQLPILRLGENLLLEFDVLNGNEDDFYYKIEHFNSIEGLKEFLQEITSKNTIGSDGYLMQAGLIPPSNREIEKNEVELRKNL